MDNFNSRNTPPVSNVEDLDNPTILQTLRAMKQYVVEHAVQGPKGDPGPAGTPGATGPKGEQGAQGPIGPQGEQGAPGEGFNYRGSWVDASEYRKNDIVVYSGTSYICVQDVTGSTTPPSEDGTHWDVFAARGATGPQGEKGEQGATGPQGATGATGPQGEQGEAGPQGPQGVQGPVGPQGPAGQNGTDGSSFVIKDTFESVSDLPTTGEAGDAYFVGATPPRTVYTWSPSRNAWDPQGTLQGPTGAQGPEGPQGERGPQGEQGPQGVQGPTGATGAAGSQGPRGPQGEQGPAGTTGLYTHSIGRTEGDDFIMLPTIINKSSQAFSTIYELCQYLRDEAGGDLLATVPVSGVVVRESIAYYVYRLSMDAYGGTENYTFSALPLFSDPSSTSTQGLPINAYTPFACVDFVRSLDE